MSVQKTSAHDYDVIIVGAGPAGLFSAFYLCEHSDLRVLVIEKGKAPHRRKCPINEKDGCQRCKPCNILCGIGGAGLFSDGKLNFIYKLGKTDLCQFMPVAQAQKLIDETEQIFNRFGMDGPVYPTDMPAAQSIRKTAKRHGIDLLIIKQKHLGSDRLPGYISTMADAIRSRGVVMHTSEEVRDVTIADGCVTGVITNRKSYTAPYVILAPGRAGADWIGQLALQQRLGLIQRGTTTSCRTFAISFTIRPFLSKPPSTTIRRVPSAPTGAVMWPWKTIIDLYASTGMPTGTVNRRIPISLFYPKWC